MLYNVLLKKTHQRGTFNNEWMSYELSICIYRTSSMKSKQQQQQQSSSNTKSTDNSSKQGKVLVVCVCVCVCVCDIKGITITPSNTF